MLSLYIDSISRRRHFGRHDDVSLPPSAGFGDYASRPKPCAAAYFLAVIAFLYYAACPAASSAASQVSRPIDITPATPPSARCASCDFELFARFADGRGGELADFTTFDTLTGQRAARRFLVDFWLDIFVIAARRRSYRATLDTLLVYRHRRWPPCTNTRH